MNSELLQDQDLKEYLTNTPGIPREYLRKYQFVEFILNFYARFSRFERILDKSDDAREHKMESTKFSNEKEGHSMGSNKRKLTTLWQKWPKFVFYAYILCNCHLAVAFVPQFSHDYFSWKLLNKRAKKWSILEQLENGNHSAADGGGQAAASINEAQQVNKFADYSNEIRDLEKVVEELSQLASLIGAPFMSVRFAGVFCYLNCCCFVAIAYVWGPIHDRIIAQIDFSMFESILHLRSQLARCDSLVRQVVHAFLVSSENFTLIGMRGPDSRKTARLKSAETVELISAAWTNQRPIDIDEGPASAGLRSRTAYNHHHNQGLYKRTGCELNDHLNAQKWLLAMLADGSLRPANKSLAWLKKLCTVYCNGVMLVLAYMTCAIVPAIAMVILFKNLLQRALTIGDMILFIDLAVVLTIDVISINFYTVFIPCHCWDQIRLAKRIQRQFDCCISTNWRRFLILTSEFSKNISKVEANLVRNKMNADLLFVYMHYKIAIHLFSASMRDSGLNVIPSVAGVAIFLLPISGRLVVPYMDLHHQAHFKVLVVALSLTMITVVNIVCVSICQANCSLSHLYKKLSSLLAHAEELQLRAQVGMTAINMGGQIYDRHLVMRLHKELAEPEQYSARFACKMMATNTIFSYRNLMRAHFWYGFLLLSIFAYA